MKPAIIFTVISVCLFAGFLIPGQTLFHNPEFHQQLNKFLPLSWFGATALIGTLTLLATIGLPRQFTAFICGYVFDYVYGTIIATVVVTIACAATFSLAKYCLSHYIKNNFASAYAKAHDLFQAQLLYKAMIIRLLPIGSNFLTNILAGACKLNIKAFVSGSFIGFIPQMLVFSLLGAGIKIADKTQLSISIGLFVLSFLLGCVLYLKNKQLALKV